MGVVRCGGYVFQSFFVTIATILGTGILGLPVKLSSSGVVPFVVVFSLGLAMQLGVVWLMVDLLQRTKVRMMRESEEKMRQDAEHGRASALAEGQPLVARADAAPAGHVAVPDLHAMGKMYLDGASRRVFDFSVMLHFVSILISYSLAGAQSWSELTGVAREFLIFPVVAVYGCVVVFSGEAIKPAIAVLTVVKCLVLVVIIGVMGAVASAVGLVPHDDWAAGLEPFLLGTVALGGVVNIMPVLFSSVPFTAQGMSRFRLAVSGGVAVCWLLNVLWSAFILGIVPQTEAIAVADTAHPQLATLGVSLEQAERDGEISTVPAVKVIGALRPELGWVSTSVTAFILLSVTVSFVTIGTGLKHVLDGVSREEAEATEAEDEAKREADAAGVAWRPPRPTACSALLTRPQRRWCGARRDGCRRLWPGLWTARGGLLWRCFCWLLLVLAVAQVNPQGFLVVLEVVTSFALNLEAGFLVAAMYFAAAIRTAQRPGRPRRSLRDVIGDVLADAAGTTGTPPPGRGPGSKDSLVLYQDADADAAEQEAAAAEPAGGGAAAASTTHGRSPSPAGAPPSPGPAGAIPLPLGRRAGAVLTIVVAALFGFALVFDVIDSSLRYLGPQTTGWATLCLVLLGWLHTVKKTAWPVGAAWYAALPAPPAPPSCLSCLCLSASRDDISFAIREGQTRPAVGGGVQDLGLARPDPAAPALNPVDAFDDDDDDESPRAGDSASSAGNFATEPPVLAEPDSSLAPSAPMAAKAWRNVASHRWRSRVLPTITVAAACLAMGLSADEPWALAWTGAARGLVLVHFALWLLAGGVRESCRSLEPPLLLGSFAAGALVLVPVCLWVEGFGWAGAAAVVAVTSAFVELRAHHAVWCMREAAFSRPGPDRGDGAIVVAGGGWDAKPLVGPEAAARPSAAPGAEAAGLPEEGSGLDPAGSASDDDDDDDSNSDGINHRELGSGAPAAAEGGDGASGIDHREVSTAVVVGEDDDRALGTDDDDSDDGNDSQGDGLGSP